MNTTTEDRRHRNGVISVTTKTEVLHEEHELQISANNRTGPALPNLQQHVPVRAEGIATQPRARGKVHGDGISLDSDIAGDESSQDLKINNYEQ